VPGEPSRLFDAEAWTRALEKYASVTHLTVAVYDAAGQLTCGPINPTPLVELFARYDYDPGLFAECVRRGLQPRRRKAIVVTHRSGLAATGASLVLNGDVVGVVAAGYRLVDFPRVGAIEHLAWNSRIPFARLWEIVRRAAPLSADRFAAQGELLHVLADTLLRETHRTQQYEAAVAELRATGAVKDEFLAVLSHELRTPLTPIVGWARMLKFAADPAQVARGADVIERNALLQARLVEDLLDLTRVTRGTAKLDRRVADLSEAVRSAVEAYIDAARQKSLALHVTYVDEPLLVSADVHRLQQVFRNILSNAVKFTPAGGAITVTLGKTGDRASVRVRDTGEGISAEFLPFVFDIFRQQEQGTRRRHEGLGIGLALVKRLTELQDGAVTIASEGIGRGTELTVQFPVVDGIGELGAPVPAAISVPRELRGMRILVVEDMDDTREATRLLLQRLGADVLVAKEGSEALAIVAEAQPDVVLCDLRMPQMDGFEFLSALQSRPDLPHPPVIAVSGLASLADHERTTRAGFQGHLDKPFDDAGLLVAVGAAMAGRRHG
jgi:signal transduction histidine kinase/ActR/RegA family two-component response regulator